jgi:hypothetical protein
MDKSLEIRNWLERAFEEPVGRANETYYFDKKHNQFFSIFITDYFIIDEAPDTAIDSPYNTTELNLLRDRINRTEQNDSSLLYVPRLNSKERKQILNEFIESTSHGLSIEEIGLIIENETGRNDFELPPGLNEKLKPGWKLFKTEKIQEKVDTFCNLNAIDIEKVSLWTDLKVTSMSIDLTEPKSILQKKDVIIEKKKWWKFW